MNKNRIQNILLIFMMIFWIGIIESSREIQADYVNNQSNIIIKQDFTYYDILDYNDSGPIVIDSNNDFLTLNCTGEGTKDDPYILSGWNITATGPSAMAIQVSSTTAYFIIKDNLIVADYVGIFVQSIAYGSCEITNNIIISSSNDGGAIAFNALGGCNITDNECSNFAQAIHLNIANDCLIKGNSIRSCNYQGINIRYSQRNEISYNIIEDTAQHGVAIVGTSYDNIIYQNSFCNNSKEEEYLIDGERTGEINSQGYDEGTNNTWYDEETKTGNRWTDYEGRGTYAIDGPANSEDKYPMIYSADESASTGYNTLIVIGITCISFSVIRIRRKKKRE